MWVFHYTLWNSPNAMRPMVTGMQYNLAINDMKAMFVQKYSIESWRFFEIWVQHCRYFVMVLRQWAHKYGWWGVIEYWCHYCGAYIVVAPIIIAQLVVLSVFWWPRTRCLCAIMKIWIPMTFEISHYNHTFQNESKVYLYGTGPI